MRGGKRSDKHVCTIFDSKKPHSSPLLFWLKQDILDYVEKYNVEVCEVYYDRVFDSEGNCVACDSPFSELPNEEEWKELVYDQCNQFDEYSTGVLTHTMSNGDKFYTIEGEKRTGCTFCGFGAQMEKGSNRFQRLSISHPRLHRLIMERMGMGKAMDLINVKVTFS